MPECWNAFCISEQCDGVNHYDYTGYSWSQHRGTAYNPKTGEYDKAGLNNGVVYTMYERLHSEED